MRQKSCRWKLLAWGRFPQDKTGLAHSRWRLPTLSLQEIAGAGRGKHSCVFCWFFFFFFHFLATPHGMWDLGFPTRNRTQATSIGEQSLNHWMAGEVPQHMLLAMNRVTSHSASQTWQTHHLSNRPLLFLRQIVCVCVCVCVCVYSVCV